MSLPSYDLAYLAERGQPHEISAEANMVCIVLRDYQLPQGYDRASTDLLVRLQPGYPDLPPDMWWFDPPVQRLDKRPIPAVNCVERYLGRSWQRWSRHFGSGQWRPGVDALEGFLALIRKELERCACS